MAPGTSYSAGTDIHAIDASLLEIDGTPLTHREPCVELDVAHLLAAQVRARARLEALDERRGLATREAALDHLGAR